MNKIDEFVRDNFKSEITRYKHKTNLLFFFDFLKVDPEKYIDSKRNYKDDVNKFWKSLKEKPIELQDDIMTSIMLFFNVNELLNLNDFQL